MKLRIALVLGTLAPVTLGQAPAQFVDTAATALPAAATATSGIAFGDLDRDGDLDVVLATRTGPRLYLNDGMAGFTDASNRLPVRTGLTYSAAIGDVDGDGNPDVVIGTDSTPTRDLLFLGDGRGGLRDASANLPRRVRGTQSLALADFDGDGDPDLLRGEIVGEVALLRNDGSGVFVTDPGAVPATGLPIIHFDLAVADLDGDGDLDFISADSIFSPGTRFYANDGSGSFSDITATALPGITGIDTRSLFCGDLDGDGDSDLAIAAARLGGRLYLNDGTGVYRDASSRLPAMGNLVVGLAGGDFDEDGDADLLYSINNFTRGAADALLINDGSGNFADATALRLSAPARSGTVVETADLDGDGDLDVLAGTGNVLIAEPDQLYRNRHRHLETSIAPAVGGSYGLRVIAAPGYGAGLRLAIPVLGFGLLPAPVAVPPFGDIRIDPAGAVPLPWVSIPPQTATGELVIAVPPDPALAGTALHAQALLLELFGPTPPRLSGFTADAISR